MMECPSCGRENESHSLFCNGCGLSLQLACSDCGRTSSPDASYCSGCGNRLGVDAGSTIQSTHRPSKPVEDLPAFFKAGRYVVKSLLGEGARKKVYLVEDTVLDREVAFALIKTEGLDDVGRQRILREAQTMGRLSDHPNIVPLYDLGDEAGQPYMVSPVLTGGDIERRIAEGTDQRLPIGEAIAIAKSVCRGLDFAHSKGIIHRDLKPSNVYLSGDGTAKIGDFGLAIASDRSRLTQDGALVGTVWYMSPEQATGAKVDSRTDLYALGAMIYEMVTGQPPFTADDSVAIISQHINTPPVAPTWHNPQCPPLLETIVLRLLAKEPDARYASAQDVLAALDAIDIVAGAEEPESNGAKQGAQESAAGDAFVGRQRELNELKVVLEEALSGHGQLVMITGDPGIGKTRMATELATYATLRGVQVLWGRCHQTSGVPDYWPWVQAVRSYVRDRDAEQLSAEMGAGAAYISDILPEVRSRIPNVGESDIVEPAQAQFRLFDSIANFLRSAANSQPMMIVLEDLHWADLPSLLLLEFLARELGGMRLLIASTHREDEVDRAHHLSQMLVNLAGRSMVKQAPLGGVSRDGVEEFIRTSAGIDPPAGLVDAVYGRTEGHPLYLTEIVRHMSSSGELSESAVATTRRWSIRVPVGVQELVRQRVERLSQRTGAVLSAAAMIGREFDLGLLGRIEEDASSDQLLDALEEGKARRLIQEVEESQDQYQFTHVLLQEGLADKLSPSRRSELGRLTSEARVAELARQFGDVETSAGAQTSVREALAGEKALASNAYEEAIGHFQRALATGDGEKVDAEAAALIFGLGRAEASTREVSKLRSAVTNLGRAFDYFAKTGEVDRAISVAEYLPVARGTANVLVRALAMVGPESYEAGRILPAFGMSLGTEDGDYEGAQNAFERARAIAERRQDAVLDLKALAGAAYVDTLYLHWSGALEKGLKAIELARRVNEPLSGVMARFVTATSLYVLGDAEAAALHAASAITASEKLRDRPWQAAAIWVNETLSRLRGKWSEARALSHRGLSLSDMDLRLHGTRALLEYEAGESAQGDLFIGRLLDAMSPTSETSVMGRACPALVLPLAARLTGRDSHLDVAVDAAEELLASSSPRQVAQMARAGLGMVAVVSGDQAGAAQQHAALDGLKDSMMPVGMAGDRLLGLLAMTKGSLDEAVAHFDDGLAFCLRAWYRPEYAWSCHDCADALLKRDDDGDRERAASLLDQARGIARELAMRPLAERVESRL